MSKRIIEQLRHTQTFNKGFWLSAKIYSDQRGGCVCGGKFTAIAEMDGMEYPKCEKCSKAPTLFRIRARIITENKESVPVDLRHNQNGKRLTKAYDCLAMLERVQEEIERGAFDAKKYLSKESRESYLFENFIETYKASVEKKVKRKELTPKAFINKKTAINHLVIFFRGKDISAIKNSDIDDFKESFVDRFRARDLALGELQAILNYALRKELINKIPKFEIVKTSKKRKEIISLDVAAKVIDAIEDDQYKVMLRILWTYPLRPSELRALTWSDVDYFSELFLVRKHFSVDQLIDGRKSISDGEKAEIEFPLNGFFKDYLLSIPRPLKKDAFIFKGKEKDFVTAKCLAQAWRKATQKLKLPDYEMYEMRHARLTFIAEQSNGDMVKLLRISGHTNPKTLMERYVRDTSDLKEYFQ